MASLLRGLRLGDQSRALFDVLSRCFVECIGMQFARGKIGALQSRDLGSIILPPGGPGEGVGQVGAPQQQIVGAAASSVSQIPAECGLN